VNDNGNKLVAPLNQNLQIFPNPFPKHTDNNMMEQNTVEQEDDYLDYDEIVGMIEVDKKIENSPRPQKRGIYAEVPLS